VNSTSPGSDREEGGNLQRREVEEDLGQPGRDYLLFHSRGLYSPHPLGRRGRRIFREREGKKDSGGGKINSHAGRSSECRGGGGGFRPSKEEKAGPMAKKKGGLVRRGFNLPDMTGQKKREREKLRFTSGRGKKKKTNKIPTKYLSWR